jgi:predicted permease
MPALWQRVKEVFHRQRLDRELDDEVAFHLQMLEEQYRKRGFSARDAAAAARKEFGGIAHTAEIYRDERGLPWLETLGKDIRYALRGFRRNPGFVTAAVLSLALGIGANTAVFSLFRAVMLRMLPVERPQELVSLYKLGGWGRGVVSYPLYQEIAKRSDLFRDVAGTNTAFKVRFSAASGHRTDFARREYVTGSYFGMLGVRPAIGRLFTGEVDRTPHGAPLAVLSYDFWRSRFGANPGILGRTLSVDEQTLTVIGVAAPEFHGVQVEERTDVWVPMVMSPWKIENPGMNWLMVIARRRPGVSLRQVQAALDALMRHHLQQQYGHNSDAGFRKLAMSQHLEVREAAAGISALRDRFSQPLIILMAAVGLVLLAACANVANLLLARGAARQKETALCFSLGATRGRLIRQALTESLMLAAAGCALGVAFAFWAERLVLHVLPAAPTERLDAAPDGMVFGFTLGISALSVILFGLVPALRSTAVSPATGLGTGLDRGNGRRPVLRRLLVSVQVAFSVVLVVLAALFGHSLAELRSIHLGVRNQNVVAFQLDFPRAWKSADINAARNRMLSRLEVMPGVVSVSQGFPGPFQMGFSSASIRVPGSERTAHESAQVAPHSVGPGYFETLGSPPILGREIDRNDTATSRKVAVVNEAFLREFMPDEKHPLERTLSFDDSKPEGGEPTFIVGVVRDILHQGLRGGQQPYGVPAAGSERQRLVGTDDPGSLANTRGVAGRHYPRRIGKARSADRDHERAQDNPPGGGRFDLRRPPAGDAGRLLRCAGAGAGRDRTLRRDRLWNRAAIGRIRHSHRARRAADLGTVDGAARCPDPNCRWFVPGPAGRLGCGERGGFGIVRDQAGRPGSVRHHRRGASCDRLGSGVPACPAFRLDGSYARSAA